MKYWLLIDSWNLMESFVTESISPYSFYQERGFGNNLSRFFKVGSEKINHLILSTKEPKSYGTFSIVDCFWISKHSFLFSTFNEQSNI